MGRYSALIRIGLLVVVLVGGAMFVSPALAQDAGAAGDAPVDQPSTMSVLFKLVTGHVDAVTVTIALLSIYAVTLIIQGFMKNRESVMMPAATTERIREMINNRQFRELIEFTETDPSFVSKALNPALKRAPSFSSMKEAMETAIGEQTAEQFRKIEYLNIIGNLGPLLGLLGTVLGMIVAFDAMQRAEGNASPAQLAGGIAIALAHTFMGLFLAVPALAAFGILRTLVDRLTVRGALQAEELLLMIKPAETKPAARPGAAPAPAIKKPAPAPAPATA
jgi:biopolymer transport protein ExbB